MAPPVNLNTASSKAISALPGIGVAKLNQLETLRAALREQDELRTYDTLIDANILSQDGWDRMLDNMICFEGTVDVPPESADPILMILQMMTAFCSSFEESFA